MNSTDHWKSYWQIFEWDVHPCQHNQYECAKNHNQSCEYFRKIYGNPFTRPLFETSIREVVNCTLLFKIKPFKSAKEVYTTTNITKMIEGVEYSNEHSNSNDETLEFVRHRNKTRNQPYYESKDRQRDNKCQHVFLSSEGFKYPNGWYRFCRLCKESVFVSE